MGFLNYSLTKIRKLFSPLGSPTVRKNIRHLFCLTIKLRNHSTIYFSIFVRFFYFLHFCLTVYIYSWYCILHCCLCVFLALCCLILWPQNRINTTTTTESHLGRYVKSINFQAAKRHRQPFLLLFRMHWEGYRQKQTKYANISYLTSKVCKFHVNEIPVT